MFDFKAKACGEVRDVYREDACDDHYRIGKTLGTGTFATVKEGFAKEDGKMWAIKCIRKVALITC